MSKNKLIAVFGSLRKGLGNHPLIENEEYIGTCRTKDKFSMFSYGAFPGLSLQERTNITIEVYNPTTNGIMDRLDRLEGYPTFYNRKVIETDFGDAWIYFNENQDISDDNTIKSGDWFNFLKNEDE
ncbi:MAG: gamma-glutamylcyclotransferase family protein [Candidatus Hodarchaeales archaeon]|jgi:gamma-glutamylcyclotransferase (GGCT)/AIG2-like uncharacterized protein YtfP